MKRSPSAAGERVSHIGQGALGLDGVSLGMRPSAGWKRVHMPVAYAVRLDGAARHLLAVQRSSGDSQQDWQGLLQICIAAD